MDSYQLGKDIQSLHQKLDNIAGKKCGCGDSSGSLPNSSEVAISRFLLRELLEQFHYLADISSGLVDGATWAGFVQKYHVGHKTRSGKAFGSDWCCRCDTVVGGRGCFTLWALTEADAWTSCIAQNSSSCGSSITKEECDDSDECMKRA
jgi:hypothetical protein